MNVKNIFNENVYLSDVTFDSLIINGTLDCESLKVLGNIRINGALQGKIVEAQEIVVNGSCYLTHATAGKCTISGATELESIKINNVIVAGDCIIKDGIIEDHLVVEGTLKASHCTLGEVRLHAFSSVFESTTVEKNIILEEVINKNSWAYWLAKWSLVRWFFNHYYTQPLQEKIEIKGTTRIIGNIIAKSGTGIIYCGPEAVIQGRVMGAQVIKLKS